MRQRITITITIALVSLLGFAPTARADTILTYSGPAFTFGNSSYTHLTVTLDLASPLPAIPGQRTNIGLVNPLSFSFSDGIDTITNQTATASFFQFDIGGDGSFIGWSIQASTPTLELLSLGGENTAAFPCFDCVDIPVPGGVGAVLAGEIGPDGQWSVPEPLSLVSVMLAVVIVAFLYRRFSFGRSGKNSGSRTNSEAFS